MAWPVVVVPSGGLPVTESTNGLGLPVEIATNGFGIAVTIVSAGGLPVIGSGTPGAPYTLLAGKGTFVLTGDTMLPRSAFVVPAALGTFALTGQAATLTYTPISSYTGPGDIKTFAAWWGLRAYSAATVGTSCIDIVDQAGANPLTVNTLANGNLDVASIATWVTANSVSTIKISKIYDKVSTNHLAQATLASMPVLTLSAIGSLPGITFASQNLKSPTAPTVAQDFTVSYVYKETTHTSYEVVFAANNNAVQTGPDTSSGLVFMYAGGGVPVVTAAFNTYHSVQANYSGASSNITVDTTSTAMSTGTNSVTTDMTIGADGSGASPFTGLIHEVGVSSGTWSGGDNTNMESNQKTYWGY